MKIKLIKNNCKQKTELPVIMESNGQPGLIFLFTGETSGVLLHSGKSYRKAGDYETGLVPYFDEIVWKKYKGKIELKNES